MPTPCNLKVDEYPGSSEKEGREGTCDVFEIEHHIHQPVDLSTGQARCVREMSPIVVTPARRDCSAPCRTASASRSGRPGSRRNAMSFPIQVNKSLAGILPA